MFSYQLPETRLTCGLAPMPRTDGSVQLVPDDLDTVVLPNIMSWPVWERRT